MGQHDQPQHGYLCTAEELLPIIDMQLSSESYDLFVKAMKSGDYQEFDHCVAIAKDALKSAKMAQPYGYVFLTDDDVAGDLELNVLYLAFNETDLYVKNSTKKHKEMRHAGIFPEIHTWSTWG